MTTLNVANADGGQIAVDYPKNHPQVEQIDKWLGYLSPGYVEYLLKFGGNDPHCNACRDSECENQGMGDDACPAFKFGEGW